ncbi:MAG: DUF6503 family protein [Flavobacteriaceae bacterium]
MKVFKKTLKLLLFVFVCMTSFSCGYDLESAAQSLIDQAIESHGQELLKTHDVVFRFRDKLYKLQRSKNGYIYERSFVQDNDSITDQLYSDGVFARSVNGQSVILADSLALSYSNSLNSVMYFFQLPYVLNDPAAIKRFRGTAIIEGRPHFVVAVTFEQERGGTDYEDEFRYWFDAQTLKMNYLAYSYHTNGGGVRFRVATNPKDHQGLWVQDYDNYMPKSANTPLDSLPRLWQTGALEKVSRIAQEEVWVLARN